MLVGFKTELHPTKQQKTLLAKHAGIARHAYNWGSSVILSFEVMKSFAPHRWQMFSFV
ncbi:helix-turn-helix domain-containing protein [Dapis sp. BLCC M172]|uniref:helix-turn-helix domain-containing protein n=1 Tax=Dapis sp. BLCC M172 TaxID=2975281 RepID=UPI003CEC232D